MCHVEAESMLEPRLSSIISLPVFAPERGSGARGASASPFGHGQRGVNVLKGLRVLVVEDDPDARELVMTILEEAGAVVQSAPSAASGFAAIGTFHPQLIVSDIGMPETDGYGLIAQIREHERVIGRRALPAIAATAYARADDRQKSLLAGYQLHIAKPIEPRELVAAIASLLRVTGVS